MIDYGQYHPKMREHLTAVAEWNRQVVKFNMQWINFYYYLTFGDFQNKDK